MASWTNIPNSSLETGAPARSVDALAFRDNPVAIAEGATGAPKIQTLGLADDCVTNNKIQSPSAGTGYLIRRLQDSVFSTDSTIYTTTGAFSGAYENRHLGVACLVSGTITVYAEHYASNSNNLSYLRVLKNGSQVIEWTTSSSAPVARQVNISVNIGDVIIFQQKVSGTFGTVASLWDNLRIYSNNPNFAVA